MGLVLGKDGKRWAMEPVTGFSPNYYPNLYVGLLSTLPADYDKLEFNTLVTGNEFVPDADFYTTGRLAVTLGNSTFDPASGAYVRSNTAGLNWPNANATRNIEGVFITNHQSGTSGQSMWVGPPDIGSLTIAAGSPANIPIGGLVCSID